MAKTALTGIRRTLKEKIPINPFMLPPLQLSYDKREFGFIDCDRMSILDCITMEKMLNNSGLFIKIALKPNVQ